MGLRRNSGDVPRCGVTLDLALNVEEAPCEASKEPAKNFRRNTQWPCPSLPLIEVLDALKASDSTEVIRQALQGDLAAVDRCRGDRVQSVTTTIRSFPQLIAQPFWRTCPLMTRTARRRADGRTYSCAANRANSAKFEHRW